jgi:hypothetical protein
MSEEKSKKPPVLSVNVESGVATFKYEGPYPIGVGFSTVKNGHRNHTEATLEPGESCVFSLREGVTYVSCCWGYGPAVVADLRMPATAG